MTVRCAETRDGRTVGELEVAPFSAALILDRDGILEEKVRGVAGATATTPIVLPNASGFRAATFASSTPLPYVYVFAFAPLGVDGGVLVVVRSAQPAWVRTPDCMTPRYVTPGDRGRIFLSPP